MPSEERTTILRPSEPDPNKAPIENLLEVTELGVLGPDIFTNARQQWHPPGARGIYGGAVIAQCLESAQKTLPSDFLPHSCHCYFLLAGSASTPILFHVERVRDGRSFATRTVQARQRGRCIFTTTISFSRSGDSSKKMVHHGAPMPQDALRTKPADDYTTDLSDRSNGPIMAAGLQVLRSDDVTAKPEDRRVRTWMRARGKISQEGGHQAHLTALAYLSDSYFIGTVSRIHSLWRNSVKARDVHKLPKSQQEAIKKMLVLEGMGDDPSAWADRPEVGMQVSLDHSIYFHEPRKLRADEWLLCDMESPWAGDERGVVTQRIFAADGTLVASCMQEGVVRLKQDGGEKSAKI